MNLHYHNHVKAKEIMSYIAEYYRKEQMTRIQRSQYIGIQCDESTDVGMKSHLVVCVQYISEEKFSSEYMNLFELESQTSETVFKTLWNFLTKHNLEKKLVSLAVDGAPAMISNINGVYGKLRQKIPSLMVNHCPIHRLALVVKSLGKPKKPKKNEILTDIQKDEYIMKLEMKHFNNHIHSLIAFFTCSSKRLKILEDNED